MTKNAEKTTTGRSQIVGSSVIVEKRVWVASDGTEFMQKEAAEKYEEASQNPYYKALKTKAEGLKAKVEQLERTVELLQSRSTPFQGPQVMLNGQRDTGEHYVS